MKKAFLILSIVAVLVCLLAISVSADEIKKFDTDEFQAGDNITYIDGIDLGAYYKDTNRGNPIDTLYDNTTVARIVLQNSDGTYTTYPTYIKDGDKIFYLDNGETVETVETKSFNDISKTY